MFEMIHWFEHGKKIINMTRRQMQFDYCHFKKVFEHVPFYLSELVYTFLQFRNHHVSGIVTGKRVNGGAGFGF